MWPILDKIPQTIYLQITVFWKNTFILSRSMGYICKYKYFCVTLIAHYFTDLRKELYLKCKLDNYQAF